MESSLNDLIQSICVQYKLDTNKVLKDHHEKIHEFIHEYEDPEIHLRCKGKNKNGKRCSKSKKENSEFCSVHYNQQKDKDNDFIYAEEVEKDKSDKADKTKSDKNQKNEKEDEKSNGSSIQILDAKKKGILPEKIKKILYDTKKYYINKNDWVYEMNQESEVILSDIPIGRMFAGKMVVLKIDEI